MNISILKDNGIGIIQLDDSNNENLFSSSELKLMNEALLDLESDKNIDVILLKSNVDGIFCNGSDICKLKEMGETEGKVFSSYGQRTISTIRQSKKIIIALVDGIALGAGFEMILAADIIFATTHSSFGFPEVNCGFIPGFGGTQLASRRFNNTLCKYLIFTGESISADKMADSGVITHLFSDKVSMEDYCQTFIKSLKNKSIFILGLAKETINNGIETDLERGLLIEQNAFAVAFSSNDKREGMTAFIEKRKPVFSDRWEDFQEIK